jgi:thioesterase domain-containing protein/malonyl CoA-acyl carrier protein transacylase
VASISGCASLSLAAVNAPSQCVVSGPGEMIARLHASCSQAAITCRLLHTSHAFHSSMMEPILDKFREHVDNIRLSPPQLPFISNVTGTWISTQDACSPDYWAVHMRSCVRFADGLKCLSAENYSLLEVGPGQTLSKLVRRQDHGIGTFCVASLPDQSEKEYNVTANTSSRKLLLATLGKLWLAGVKINWGMLYSQKDHIRLSLPTYAFERKRYWTDSSVLEHKSQFSSAEEVSLGQSRPLSLSSSYVAPRNALEESLAEIFASNLYTHPIGIEDNFFELGGDSLLAIQMTARLSQMFDVKLNQSQLVDTPTIKNLAAIIQGSKRGKPSVVSSLIELQSGTSQPPLFFIHPAGGSVFCYRSLVQYLSSQRPIYGIEDPALHRNSNFTSFSDKAIYYISLIRQVQPEGPYFLAGYSYGGNMAWEMAIRLQEQGQEIKYLGLIDSFPPISYEQIAVDDTRLLAAVWYMTSLIFEKSPRQWYDELKQVGVDHQLEFVVQQLLADSSGIPLSDAVIQPQTLQVAMENFRELHFYVPSDVFMGEITFFWAKDNIPHGLSELLNYQIPKDLIADGWGKLTSQPVKTCFVPGHHFTMFNETNIRELAVKILNSLPQH